MFFKFLFYIPAGCLLLPTSVIPFEDIIPSTPVVLMFVKLCINRNIKTIKAGSSSRAFIIFKVVSLIITT